MRPVLWCVAVVVAGCTPLQSYSYQRGAGGPEKSLPPVEARVVAAREAEQSGLHARRVVLQFQGARDGTDLVTQFLKEADRTGAEFVAELALFLETTQDGEAVECRTEIVPESVTETQLIPAQHKLVPVQQPVQRMVTEYQTHCRPVMESQQRTYTEYQQRCSMQSHPVTRTRTTYSTEYDSFSRSSRSVPRTESYTSYESRQECRSEPVMQTRTEMVSRTQCSPELVTRSVTRYEFQLTSQYVPARLETLTRQRLRELDPVCYEVPAASDDPALAPPSQQRGNRLEGRVFGKPPAPANAPREPVPAR